MAAERVDLKSFEATFEELESIVRRLEGGALTLDESLSQYEQGVAALKHCYRVLEEAEKRLEVLVRGESGAPAAKPADLAQLRGEARGEAKVGPKAPAADEARMVVEREAKVVIAETKTVTIEPKPTEKVAEKPAEKRAAPASATAEKKKESGEKSLFGL